MKPIHILTLAVLALAIGCTKTETLSSGGIGEDNEPEVAKGAVTDATDATGDIELPGFEDVTADNETGLPLAPPPDDEKKDDAAKPEEKPDPSLTAKSVTGKYDGAIDVPQATIDMAKQMAASQGGTPEQVEAFIKQIEDEKITLELLADGTFAMTTASQGDTPPDKGQWKLNDDNTVTLTPNKLTAEQRANLKKSGATDAQIEQTEKMARQPQTLKVTEGGKVLTWSQANMGMTMTVTFTRK